MGEERGLVVAPARAPVARPFEHAYDLQAERRIDCAVALQRGTCLAPFESERQASQPMRIRCTSAELIRS